MAKSTSPVFRIDFTLSFDRDFLKSTNILANPQDIDDLASELKSFLYHDCEQYMFQIELTGDSNYHIQGRVNLKSKQRTSTYAKKIEDVFDSTKMFYRVSCSPTNVHCRTFSYVMKPETRIAGPWANRPLFLGRSILLEKDLKIWHKRIVQLLERYDSSPLEYRKLINIVDTKGGQGKSSLVKYLSYYYAQDVSYVDIWGTLSQISNSVVGEGARKMYLIDLPKSFNSSSTKFSGDKVEQLASLLERIKDGGPLKATMRGGFESLIFDPPVTILFSNWAVSSNCFTAGRLIILNLADLVPTVPNSLIKEWNELNDEWQWFFESEFIFNELLSSMPEEKEAAEHDNGCA